MIFIEALKNSFPGFADLQDLPAREKETLYGAAYGIYESGEYEKGANLFTRLLLHDPYDLRFWKGLASCHQMLCEYKEALYAWSIVSLLGENPPQAHFHAAECYLSLEDRDEAKKALNCAKHFLQNNDPLKRKIEQLHEQVHHG